MEVPDEEVMVHKVIVEIIDDQESKFTTDLTIYRH